MTDSRPAHRMFTTMARKGFLTGLHRVAKEIARENERQRKESQRAYEGALRAAADAHKREQQAQERAKVAAQRQQQQSYAQALKSEAKAQKEAAADLKRLEKEARESHEFAMATEVECRNLKLAAMEDELETILAATLAVDDFVDLNTLRVAADHPPFNRQDLLTPSRPPLPIVDDPKPAHVVPPAPRGVLGLLAMGKYEKAKALAAISYHEELTQWKAEVARNEQRRMAEAAAYEERERARIALLEQERERYSAECRQREAEAVARNEEVDELVTNLAYGSPDAVEEYIGIVLSNAVYPEHFPISHVYSYDPSTAELRVAVAVIAPERFSTVKGYKHVKSSDEILEIHYSDKANRDRYASAIHQVALRVPHEIFEADRRGLISTISFEVGAHGCDPATGRSAFIPLVALGVSREDFMKIELGNVQPSATLAHFGASVSKNPYGMVPAITSGVRKS